MDKKGFTLIELIAVVVIMAIIAMIATPNIINMIDSGNKGKYISDAKIFISKANTMYKQEKHANKFSSDGKLKLNNIEKPLTTDPYGFKYVLEDSYVRIDTSDGIKKIYIYLISCKADEAGELTTECHSIENNGQPVLSSSLTEDDVK